MSMIAIKGMEMPSECMECMFCNHIKNNDYSLRYGDCAILGDGEIMNLLLHRKHTDCPLVEIVTCKDCAIGGREHSESGKYCIHTGRITEDDFYCADAERRE